RREFPSGLRGLILHQGDQRRDDYRGAPHRERGKLVAERFPAAGRHDDAYVAPGQNAAHDALLDGTKAVVAPISAQWSEEVDFGGQATIVASDYSPRRIIVARSHPRRRSRFRRAPLYPSTLYR